MNNAEVEVTFGVQAFGKLLIKASAAREVELRELFVDEPYLESQMLRINNVLKAFIDENYPHDQNKFNKFIQDIDAIGKIETQDIAMKVSKYIWEYMNQGITLDSISSGISPTSSQLENYVVKKVQSIFYNLVSEFVDPDENENAELALQEICRLVVSAGYQFFARKFNRSGEAINGGFTSGVGLVMQFRISDEYDALALS